MMGSAELGNDQFWLVLLKTCVQTRERVKQTLCSYRRQKQEHWQQQQFCNARNRGFLLLTLISWVCSGRCVGVLASRLQFP